MIGRRVLLLALIVAASTTFIVGVALERSGDADHHVTNAASTHREPAEGGENATDHAAETTGDAGAGAELRPLGIDVEAWPFVTTAVLAGLVAVLHFAAATVAASMALRARGPQGGLAGQAGTMAA